MFRLVTARAERNQIVFGIVSQASARTDVVNLEIPSCAAVLTAPAVAREHFASELAIRIAFKP